LESLTESLEGKIIFSAIKGIVPESSLIVGEHFHTKYDIPFENIGVITGPCHAEEVAMERLSYLTIACSDKKKAKYVAKNLSSHYIKAKTTDDIIGTEYAAVIKSGGKTLFKTEYYNSVSIPIDLAEPATILAATSLSSVFKSAIFIFTISIT
jgi:hypothetical protein